jgi:hypothetical protein
MKAAAKTGGRGMVFTMDLMVSVFFFMVILLSMLWVWGESHRHMNEFREASGKSRRIGEVATILVKSPGNPRNWETQLMLSPDTVSAMGLAGEPNVLDPVKLDQMNSMDYEMLREVLGLGTENFTIIVSSNYSGKPVVLYSKGMESDAGERLTAKRYALLNGTRVELELATYYNKR